MAQHQGEPINYRAMTPGRPGPVIDASCAAGEALSHAAKGRGHPADRPGWDSSMVGEQNAVGQGRTCRALDLDLSTSIKVTSLALAAGEVWMDATLEANHQRCPNEACIAIKDIYVTLKVEAVWTQR
ncbi:unnamed protein product [Pleuronectes platessa]|uniref:Uncharacterized protein n=1 Tax=Pleuronectes platessa TaxID=8262 RepID=A0A9N7VBZ4_PLEPL|nr:unnamed protein product [Pleuronectes platessa]